MQYGSANQVLSLNYFGASESRTYNTLVQLTNVTIPGQINMTYNYPAGANSGKISSQSDSISGETVTYTYDSLNRLLTASGSGWNQSFGYDAFGNLVSKSGSNSPPLSISVNAATNQIQGVSGLSYDANGNQLYGGVAFDSENRIVTAPGVQYAYDSQNKRIWKGTFSGSTMTAQEAYFYGVDGQKLGTYSLYLNTTSPVYLSCTNTNLAVFFGGKRVAVNGVAFVQDRLGSQGKYFPYGEDRGTPLPNDQVKFATYTRDSATGLDYADQRYYSNQFARFMTPDPYKASGGPAEPMSWNQYTHTRGDPINRTDVRGLQDESPNDPCRENPNQPACNPLPSPIVPPDQYVEPTLPDAPNEVANKPPNINSALRGKAEQAIIGLSPGCQHELGSHWNLYSGELSLLYKVNDKNQFAANFFDARDKQVGNLQMNYWGYNSSMSTSDYVNSEDRIAFVSISGSKISNSVVLGSAFFNATAAEQAATLVHEVLHSYTGWGDVDLARAIFGTEFVTEELASKAINKFLQVGCDFDKYFQ